MAADDPACSLISENVSVHDDTSPSMSLMRPRVFQEHTVEWVTVREVSPHVTVKKSDEIKVPVLPESDEASTESSFNEIPLSPVRHRQPPISYRPEDSLTRASPSISKTKSPSTFQGASCHANTNKIRKNKPFEVPSVE